MAEKRLSKIQKDIIFCILHNKKTNLNPISVLHSIHKNLHGHEPKKVRSIYGDSYYKYADGFIQNKSFYRSIQNLIQKKILKKIKTKRAKMKIGSSYLFYNKPIEIKNKDGYLYIKKGNCYGKSDNIEYYRVDMRLLKRYSFHGYSTIRKMKVRKQNANN